MEAAEERHLDAFHGGGRYLAAKSEAEVYEAEISRERAEVEENPEEEIEEMSLFYQLQGFSVEESQRMAERLAEQPEQFVQVMARSELGAYLTALFLMCVNRQSDNQDHEHS